MRKSGFVKSFFAVSTASVIIAALGACASLPQPSTATDPKGFVLERDLVGRTYARGIFKGNLGAPTRAFNVVLDGDKKGDILTLREVFAYDDGERDVKTWVFQKTAPGRYIGTREDVIGSAVVVEESGRLTLSYEAEVGTRKTRVRFEDIIERRVDGVIVNRAVVSKLGLKVGDVELLFSESPEIFTRKASDKF
jgi:hypothetical protein